MRMGARKRWVITGVAGFIGSHLLGRLLADGQDVVGVDNFATSDGSRLEAVRRALGAERWQHFRFLEADAAHLSSRFAEIGPVDHVLHQAALCSVPESIADPRTYYLNNLLSTMEMLEGLRQGWCGRLVFASSSAVYGEGGGTPNEESQPLHPMSPYGESKRLSELLAAQYSRCHGVEWVALRYFNVYGPGQRFAGPYSSVLQVWAHAVKEGQPCRIHGDGLAVRDFVPVSQVVDFNLLAAGLPAASVNCAYNVASGQAMTLLELYAAFQRVVRARLGRALPDPVFSDPRPGDIRHSTADMRLARARFPRLPRPDLEADLAGLIAAALG